MENQFLSKQKCVQLVCAFVMLFVGLPALSRPHSAHKGYEKRVERLKKKLRKIKREQRSENHGGRHKQGKHEAQGAPRRAHNGRTHKSEPAAIDIRRQAGLNVPVADVSHKVVTPGEPKKRSGRKPVVRTNGEQPVEKRIERSARTPAEGAPVPAQQPAPQNDQKSVRELFERFLDKKDNQLSWVCTVDQLVKILRANQSGKNSALIQDLEKSRNQADAMAIAGLLSKHEAIAKDPQIAALLGKHNPMQLLEIMNKRIALNGKTNC